MNNGYIKCSVKVSYMSLASDGDVQTLHLQKLKMDLETPSNNQEVEDNTMAAHFYTYCIYVFICRVMNQTNP